MRPHHDVFLVPGFFGFTSLGGLSYFAHVRRALEHEAERAGARIAVHDVAVPPTGSIRDRARALLDAITARAAAAGAIDLIGHSTGGLDARMLASPGVSLAGVASDAIEPWAARIRSILTVATPHRGTPAATFFRTAFGLQILQVLSLTTIAGLSLGPLPVATLAMVARVVRRVDRELGLPGGLLHALEEQVLRDFSAERRGQIVEFLGRVASDGALITQLTPEGTDLLNAGLSERPGVRYGSIVCRARRPGLVSALRVGPSPSALASHVVYALLHSIVARSRSPLGGDLAPAQVAALRIGFGGLPSSSDNDGVVPTSSQPWGKVVAAVWADHLDVLGHFDGERLSPRHHDWLSSGTRYGSRQFDDTWRRAFAFSVGEG